MPIASPRYVFTQTMVANTCTKNATHYGWEISGHPPVREAELLREFEQISKRLPRCNRS